MQIERAAHFEELLGPYSTFGFNHPGPLSSYYFAAVGPLLAFVPTPAGRQLLAQLFLNFACLIVALHTVYAVGQHRSASLLLFGAFALVFARSPLTALTADPLSYTWSPFRLIFPMLALLTTCSALAIGRLTFLLPATLAGVVIMHNHLSAILIVGPILAGSAMSCAWRRRCRRPSRGEWWVLATSAAVLVVASLPLIIEQFAYPDGNLSKILAYTAAHGGQQHPWRISGHFIAGYFKAPVAFLGINGEFWATATLLGAFVGWRTAGRFERALALSYVSALFLSVAIATRVVDALYGYLLLYDQSSTPRDR